MKLQKKLLVTLTLMVAANCLVMAQLSIGLRGGLNFAKTKSEGGGISVTTDANPGITLAAIFELGLTESLAIQPELAFVQKGGKIEDYKSVVNHVDVPILVKYKFGGDSFGAYVAAGPTLGYAISGKDDGDKIEDWDGYNRFELGASLGGGAGLHIGGGMVFLDLRYLLGLSNLADDVDDFTSKNQGFSLSVGFLKNLGD